MSPVAIAFDCSFSISTCIHSVQDFQVTFQSRASVSRAPPALQAPVEIE